MNNRLIEKTNNSLIFIQQYGIKRFIRELHNRLTNFYHELRLGVNTTDMVEIKELGFENAELCNYVPMGYKAIYSLIGRIPLNVSESTFLDYGSGKGRAIIVAATFPFKKVIGIEISEELLEIAKKNINMMRYKKALCVECHQTDATKYTVPHDVNIIYFFNPFRGEVLERVVNNIFDSYKTSPRKIYIIFFNNDHFEKAIKNQNWLKKIYQTSFYPDISCGMYETQTH